MDFTVIGEMTDIEVIARGNGIGRLKTLMKRYGGKNWRKMKGLATFRTLSGSARWAELHWYEAHAPDVRDGRSSVSWSENEKSYLPFKVRSLCSLGASQDLEVRNLFEARPDRKAASEGYLRIIDESGENYLYPFRVFCARETARSYDAGFGGTSRRELIQRGKSGCRPWRLPIVSCPHVARRSDSDEFAPAGASLGKHYAVTRE